ncbi:hypothetical protein O181_071831 [Austropuccinia psidii MF-1]|uniref:Uncharacterized protein n=1 Tax=Austropuccinia psidii MF-1 TaxID=1389203 RepID=A0A9Q3F815_9BASI|nr:hypothetical protein [Austropuccinia psidii MF-1]
MEACVDKVGAGTETAWPTHPVLIPSQTQRRSRPHAVRMPIRLMQDGASTEPWIEALPSALGPGKPTAASLEYVERTINSSTASSRDLRSETLPLRPTSSCPSSEGIGIRLHGQVLAKAPVGRLNVMLDWPRRLGHTGYPNSRCAQNTCPCFKQANDLDRAGIGYFRDSISRSPLTASGPQDCCQLGFLQTHAEWGIGCFSQTEPATFK